MTPEQDRPHRVAASNGADFSDAFDGMVRNACVDGPATTLPAIVDALRDAAVAASGTEVQGTSESRTHTRSPLNLDHMLPARESGQHVGPYRLIKEIGRGGMGVV